MEEIIKIEKMKECKNKESVMISKQNVLGILHSTSGIIRDIK